MLKFLNDNPALINVVWGMFLWPLVSSVAMLLLNRWFPKTGEEWDTLSVLSPKLAAMAKILKATGFDLPGLVKWLRVFFGGPAPVLKLNRPMNAAKCQPPGVTSLLMVFMLAFSFTAMTVGCAQLIPILSEVAIVAEDAGEIVALIESAANVFFALKPNAEAQKKVAEGIADARLALTTALRAAKGAKELSEKDVDAAFADFQVAYTSLLKLVTELSIVAPDKTLQAAPGGRRVKIPEPMALKLGAHK